MLRKYLFEVYERMQTHCRAIGIILAVLLTAAVFVYNLFGGPLHNLNDIHNWSNRLLFTGYSAVVHFSLLMFLILDRDCDAGQLIIRELLVSVSLIIMFLAMNQKTFAYNSQVQPIVRAMDTKALAAIPDFSTSYSVPALTLYYLITRGPIYDMYLAKLFCIACYELLCISVAYLSRICMNAAVMVSKEELHVQRAGKGWKTDCALALSFILPQGFLSSACAAQIEVAGVLFGVLAVILLEQGKKTGLVLFGVGASICTALWLLIPLYVFRRDKWNLSIRDAFLPVLSAIILCIPGAAASSGVKAFGSLLSSMTALPVARSGVPNMVSFFPRAVLEEMPESAFLRAVPELDLITWAADNYKMSHFTILMHGLSLACMAVYLGIYVYILNRKLPELCKCLILTGTAFMCAPGLTMGAWQLVTVACMFCIIFEPSLRLPCAIIMFATAAGCAYPVTGDIMIKPVHISILCIVALGMLMDLWPGKGTLRHG